MKTLETILSELKDPMIQTLREWVAIPSVKESALPGAPFGTPIQTMLHKALSDCERLGFPTKNVDNYAGHADLGEGDDKDALAILAHLDVVPVGDGWSDHPFSGKIADGKMYGRGTSDDKGPAVAALYAMLAVKQAGIPLKRKVRLILGCDEESGWEDMAYYQKHETMPEIGFSPDADYPVINIEKGMIALELNAVPSKEGLQVVSFHTGERTNVIPGHATCLVKGDESLIEKTAAISRKYGWPVNAQKEGGAIRLTATGIPGHAAYPDGGRNAIGQLLITLRDLGAQGPLATLADKIGLTSHGEHMGAAVSDGLSGPLTCNMGIIKVSEDSLFATLDLRVPVLCDHARLIRSITDNLKGIQVTTRSVKAPHHVPEDSELVQGLLDAYHDVTGLEKKALAIGGGTYAKVLKQGVAFGASFPGDDETAHQADEHIRLESLVKSMEIFAKAIVNLAGK